jgi:hypothetical protein
LGRGVFNQQQTCKPGSVRRLKDGFYHLSCTAIADSFKQPTHPEIPIAQGGSEQPRVPDLFGFSTPEVYRNPGRPEKP